MRPDPALGSIVGGCRIDAVIGHGGMGVVYRAEQLALGRRVALKVLSAALSHDASFRARFQQEARLAASLDHPNVVPIYEAGEDGDHLYLVMRYVDGIDLRSLLQRDGALPPPRAARIVAQVAAALDAAHAKGLVHRDVKPANVMVCTDAGGDRVYLSDFGLTKPVDATTGLTRTGEWIGTPDYAAPEQIEGRRVDARTDVYALGCALFEALTGTAPFPRDVPMAKLWAHVNAPPPSLAAIDRSIPRAFDEVVRRALAKDPAERYASAGGLGRAAVAAAEDRPVPEEDRSVATGEAAALPATERLAPAPPLPPAAVSRRTARPPARRPAPARTRVTTAAPQRVPQPQRSRRSPAGLAALAALLVAAGVLVALLLSSGGSEPLRSAGTSSERRAAAAPRTDAVRSRPRRTGTTTSSSSPAAPPAGASTATGAAADDEPSPPPASGYVAYAGQGFALEHPAGWTTEKDVLQENDIPRYRSQWSDAECGCQLIVDYIPGYGETAAQNAAEVPGGTVAPASLGGFDDVARRTALAGSLHEATYFIAVGSDNYAVKASAPSASEAEEIAGHVAASLDPAGE
ncbi:MAG TPA: serine/threonine-protein kinase [Conexibacter sp.]|nr:serine/threonine-protein kinase [Conexibacter sp.]